MRWILPPLLLLASCSQPAPVVNVTPPQVNLPDLNSVNIISGNSQVAMSGQNFPSPLTVKVVNNQGVGIPNAKLNVLADTRLCVPSATSLTTDAQGEASFTLAAQAATNVSCSTTVALEGSPASSRTGVTFTGFIRPAQRVLQIPNTLNLPQLAAAIQDAANSTITLNGFQNLPALDADHTYAVYSFRRDPATTAVSCVRLAGVLDATDLSNGSKTFTLPAINMGAACGGTTGSIAAMGHNALSLSLQPLTPAAPSTTAVPNPFLVATYTTPAPGGSTTATAQPTTYGLFNLTPFQVPAGATGTVVMESPFLSYNHANSRAVITLRGLEPAPPSHFYTVYRQNEAGAIFRLGTVNIAGRTVAVSLTASLPVPDNSTPPATSLVDQKGEFHRVFVTLEPVAQNEGDFASPNPSPLLVLDTATPGVWQFRVR